MALLAREFEAISFQDVVEFCNQQIVEYTELDYKLELPRDLSKHFSAMSNRHGRLIIIGVAEERQIPGNSRYERDRPAIA